jgi:hypothetical protein
LTNPADSKTNVKQPNVPEVTTKVDPKVNAPLDPAASAIKPTEPQKPTT